jgi:hypothetical protein
MVWHSFCYQVNDVLGFGPAEPARTPTREAVC